MLNCVLDCFYEVIKYYLNILDISIYHAVTAIACQSNHMVL